VESVAADLENEFGGSVDGDALRAAVRSRVQRLSDAPVQDFVPVLVRREVRDALLRHA